MLTPVRVRGKNRRDQSRKQLAQGKETQTVKRRPGRPRKDKNTATPSAESSSTSLQAPLDPIVPNPNSTKIPLSPLERLPAELLQLIFLLQPNLNLPKASPSLGSSLASVHLKTELVIAAFTDISNDECGDLCSALLEQKWLTFEFFQHCQKTYMLQEATRVYRSHVTHLSLSEQNAAIVEMTKMFNTYYNLRERIGYHIEVWHNVMPRFVPLFRWDAADGRRYELRLTNEGTELMICEVELVLGDYMHFSMPVYNIAQYSRIPEKLLHGPWTNQKGHFLQLLLKSGCMGVDWMNSTHGEVASLGLEDAIREENICAIRALTGNSKFASSFSDELSFHLYENGDLDSVQELTDPFGKWWYGSEFPNHVPIPVGVEPTTKHLRIAVIEQGCNFEVVQALVDRPVTTIDYADPEIVNWALEKKAAAEELRRTMALGDARPEDEDEDVGSKLLCILDSKVSALRKRSQATSA
ncbi:hypothetical protein MMC13_004820 [Lambiella insularis]|nr:hypothetical protein [Lambiella insularis]